MSSIQLMSYGVDTLLLNVRCAASGKLTERWTDFARKGGILY